MKESESKSLDPIRQSAALILARYFLLHLREELKKDSSLVEHITMEGISFRELTESMIAELLEHFPDLESEEAEFNLFKRWWKRTDPPVKYRKSTFKMYNQVFLHRILDLKYGDSMHRSALFKRLASVLRKSVEYGRGMTYQSLMAGETIMLDELRKALSESENPAECRDLLMRQNQDLAYESFRFFDGILKASLKRSDDLLNTILPAPVAEELKLSGKVIPGLVPDCCVLFADMVDFTGIAEEMSPRELLDELDYCFSHFDRISSLQKMEKIKTIGDSYMCAAGLFEPSPSDPLR
ncbi:MAG: hypothetical protein KDK33_10810, partial [Leptospiraceae bacterium]|nr:hypothetical protein [Leptospiraceae bacterium]